uniref:Uncharacterized protein n=1 Tax=Arundo donax TaxID=35708 RepID=A0A0A8YJ57_ARUDO
MNCFIFETWISLFSINNEHVGYWTVVLVLCSD